MTKEIFSEVSNSKKVFTMKQAKIKRKIDNFRLISKIFIYVEYDYYY